MPYRFKDGDVKNVQMFNGYTNVQMYLKHTKINESNIHF